MKKTKTLPIIILLTALLLMLSSFCFYYYKNSLLYLSGTTTPSDRYALPILSIWGPNEDFYSYDEGLLIPGKAYDDYISNGGTEPPSAFLPANFNNLDKTVDIKATLFDTDGSTLFSADAILKIGGNSSRRYDLKPFKLEFPDKVLLDFEMAKSEEYSNIKSVNTFKKLKTRNCGVDYYGTMLRNVVTTHLAREAGFCDTPPIQPVVVYINGQYYGIEDLLPEYTDGYVGDCYGLDNNNIEIVSGGESDILSAIGYPDNKIINANDPDFRKDFESKVDIHQLLYYYAFELYTENGDWPLNNVRAWRYTGKPDENNSYSDGRFRFSIYDLDSVFEGYPDNEDPFLILFYAEYGDNDPDTQTGELWDLMASLIKYEPYKQELASDIMQLSNSVLSTEHMLEVTNYYDSKVGLEMAYESLLCPYEQTREYAAAHGEKTDVLRSILLRRKEEIYSFLNSYFGANDLYSLTLSCQNDGDIITGGIISSYGTESVTSTLCPQIDTIISAKCGPNRVFDHYEVNNTNIFEESFIINDKTFPNITDDINVKLITKESSDNFPVIISAVSAKDNNDYVILMNNTDKEITLSECYISDDKDHLGKYKLPQITLNPYAELTIAGKNSSCVTENYRANFNLRAGETIYFSIMNNGAYAIHDEVIIPHMLNYEEFRRYKNSSEFKFHKK